MFQKKFKHNLLMSESKILEDIKHYKISEHYKTQHFYFTLEHEDRKAIRDIIIYDNLDEKLIASNLIGISGFLFRRKILEYLNSSGMTSDRRLKNVGEKYTAGLDELKKLDLFHYTFKKDENKTPHVGVMAQDLQKVFPDAVIKGDDGYLCIRLEDMFYAVINAVKELDAKISDIVIKVNSIADDITTMKATIEAQQKTIDKQQEEILEIKRLLKN